VAAESYYYYIFSHAQRLWVLRAVIVVFPHAQRDCGC